MGIAVLQLAGGPVVAIVAVHHQNAFQRLFPQGLLHDRARPGLAETEKADGFGAKEPGIAVAPVGPPAGLVGMPDRSLSIFGQKLGAGWFQALGQMMHSPLQRAVADPQLSLQLAQCDPEEVMLHGCVSQQLVSK